MLDNQHLELLKGMENEKWNLLILKAVKAAEKSLEIRITDHGYSSSSTHLICFKYLIFLYYEEQRR